MLEFHLTFTGQINRKTCILCLLIKKTIYVTVCQCIKSELELTFTLNRSKNLGTAPSTLLWLLVLKKASFNVLGTAGMLVLFAYQSLELIQNGVNKNIYWVAVLWVEIPRCWQRWTERLLWADRKSLETQITTHCTRGELEQVLFQLITGILPLKSLRS